ncbi:MAG: hypothetical protein ACI4XF_00220, partial [Oscillospiraceae bacterium]
MIVKASRIKADIVVSAEYQLFKRHAFQLGIFLDKRIQVIGVFLIVASFTGGAGRLGELIDLCLKGLFEFMGYVLPFYLIVFGILLFARQTS